MASANSVAVKGANISRLNLPNIGKPFTSVRRRMLAFRAAFERELVSIHGSVSPWQAKQLRTASKCFAAAARVDLILSQAGAPGTVGLTEKKAGDATATSQKGLTHEQFVAYLDRSNRYEAECDRALRSIGLDKSKIDDPWSEIYKTPIVQLPAAATPDEGTNSQESATTPPASCQGPANASEENATESQSFKP